LGAGLAAWAQKPPVPPVLTAPQALAGPGIVSVDKDGHVMWNGKPADTKEALTAAAKAQVASGARHIRILADLNTQYLNVGRVVQEAQKADIDDVTFMPSGTVLATPRPPGPGSNVPPPPPVSKPGSKPAASQPPSGFPDPKRIFVDFTNEVYLDRKVVDMATLEQAFKAAAALKIPPEVHIEPHRLSSYGKVEQVIAAANRAGLTKLGVLGGT
jgi:biopolymer transport protein ExbD